MKLINMRSDVVTLPTDQMRDAARNAEVGDDGRREDPTTNRLQEIAADMFNREAALFFPSGTMANLSALMAHCDRGSKVLAGETIHIHKYEKGGFNPRLGGLNPSLSPKPISDTPTSIP